jgi:DNA modification methylase
MAEYMSGTSQSGSESRNPGTDALGMAWLNYTSALQPKSLIPTPWMLAMSLQADGWLLRNSIIWSKPNAMPESVRDRLSNRYEHLFLFSKSRRYWFDLDAIREQVAVKTGGTRGVYGTTDNPGGTAHRGISRYHEDGKNPGDVWEIPTSPFPGAHFATFPPDLPRRCILSGCKPGGTVLDTFHGAGTTGMVAQRLGRKYVGIDLNAEYLDLSLQTRLATGVLNFEEPA